MDSVIGKIRNLDVYPKINEDFYSRTISGGVITMASSIIMLLLFLSELKSQTQVQTNSENSTVDSVNNILDPLYMGPHDNPGMSLTSIQFNGLNFVGWSRQIKRGLAAKHKLGFITGAVKQPKNEDSVDGQKWITCDYLDSISMR